MKTALILAVLCQTPVPTEEDFWSGQHVANVLQGKCLRDDGQYRTNAEQVRHNRRAAKAKKRSKSGSVH